MSRFAACAVALFLTTAAHALWAPLYRPSYIQLRPGQTVTVTVSGAWVSGVSLYPFPHMTLRSDDPTIALVDGVLPTSSPTQVRITAIRPGVTGAHWIQWGSEYRAVSPMIVVAEEELPVAIAVEGVLALGKTVTLRAVSDEPDATFTWYNGRLDGVYSSAIGTGREITFTPSYPTRYDYWVRITSPRGAGASGISLEVVEPAPRRRAVRH
ncbi:MAG TPA: hypothetical protein VGF48_07440 [Thermoanaerobaculia bacterium]|jgi:hypothetical protein